MKDNYALYITCAKQMNSYGTADDLLKITAPKPPDTFTKQDITTQRQNLHRSSYVMLVTAQ